MLRLFVIFFFIFSGIGCTFSQNKAVEVYAFNMMYACEDDTQYRVFRIIHSQDQLINDGVDITKDIKLQQEVNNIVSILDGKNSKNLIGRDLKLEFSSIQEKSKFEKAEGIAPNCYLYYLKGNLVGENNYWLKIIN